MVATPSAPTWELTGERPIILMVGPRGAGKTSLERVVFHKLSPHETMFLHVRALGEVLLALVLAC